MKKIDLEQTRRQLHQFEKEYHEATYNNWAGIKEKAGLDKVFEKHAQLLSRQTLDAVAAYPARGTVATRGVKTLHCILTFMHMEYQLRDIAEEIFNATAKAHVIWRGKRVPFRSLQPMLLTEPDRETRLALKEVINKTLRRRINPIWRKFTEKSIQLTHELGHRNYILLCEYFQERSLYSLREQMEKFIKMTETPFQKGLERYLGANLGIPVAQADEVDIPAARRNNRFEKYFQAKRLLEVVQATWEGIGLKLESQPHLTIDLESRPCKAQRPAVFAVDPPFDIRLCVLPIGGKEDYCNLLHETEHVQHFAHIDPNLEVEYKYHGDQGFTEGMAYVFQNLIMNESWLHEMLGVKNIRAYKSFTKFWRLYDLRSQIGRFLYQMDMFESKKLHRMEKRCAEIMTRCQGVMSSGSNYLLWDGEFYIAGSIRAHFFEAQMTQTLENRFGPCWWRNKEVGPFLLQFYRDGGKWRSDEILKKLDWSGLDPAVFIRRYV